LGATLRLFKLGEHGLWLDEILTVRDVTNPWNEIHKNILASPPLYHYFIKAMHSVTGFNDFWLRIPSSLFGIFAIPSLYYALRSLYQDKACAFWGTALLTFSVFHIIYSQELRMYSLVALLAIWSTFYWNKAMESEESRDWVLYGIASALGLYTHYWFIFLIFSQCLYFSTSRIREKRPLRTALPIYTCLVIIFIPLVPLLHTQSQLPVYGHMQSPSWIDIRETFYALASIRVPSGESWIGVGRDARLPVLVISAGLLLYGLLKPGVNRSSVFRIFIANFFLPLFLALCVSVLLKPIYAAGRYTIIALPAFLMVISSAFSNCPPISFRTTRALTVSWIVLILFPLFHYYNGFEKSSWKKVFGWIEKHQQSPGTLHLEHSVPYSRWYADYYIGTKQEIAPANFNDPNMNEVFLIRHISDKKTTPPSNFYEIKNQSSIGNLIVSQTTRK